MERINEIVDWLKQKQSESHTSGFVVGLSGGIDSAVVCGLLKKAAPDNCLGLILPAGNSESDKTDAVKTAEAFGMPYLEIPLGAYRNDLFRDVEEGLKTLDKAVADKQMTLGNLGARLRMATLYAVGNSLNYLVVGTDNAAEVYTGYFTKYGDGGVDILPLAHLQKAEVYDLAEILGVPQSVIQKPPSAGFFADQTDEKEMGVSYRAIDAFLRGEEISPEEKAIIQRLHRVSEHKRHLPQGLRTADKDN